MANAQSVGSCFIDVAACASVKRNNCGSCGNTSAGQGLSNSDSAGRDAGNGEGFPYDGADKGSANLTAWANGVLSLTRNNGENDFGLVIDHH